MAKEKQHTPISVNKKLKYEEQYNLYTVQLVHRRRFPWWILLLLLPLLLFIKCHKDIEVRCLEPNTVFPIEDQAVTMEYQAHFLWNNGHVLTNDTIKLTQNTDSTGTTVFRDLPCSVYSYIFYCLSQASFTAESECYVTINEEHNFHYTRHVDLKIPPKREDLHVKLVDLETGDPLPDGILKYQYMESGKERIDSAKADPSGVVTIPQMRYCSIMKLLHGSCYGYADTTKIDVPCHQLLVPDDSATLRLRPLKERFSFYVKNEDTKEPIPGAICEVTLTHPISGKVDGPHTVSTSTDGKGIVVYEESFVLSVIGVKAHKEHFRDSVLTGGPWTVEKFIVQDDETRTIWLKPLPYTTEFINVDSITGKPISGVKNIIKVTDSDGTVHTSEEYSNSNGVFLVNAKEDSRVEIVSTKDVYYKQKQTVIPKFKDVQDKKIRMSPYMVKLVFRTVHAIKPNTLVPNCNLVVRGTISESLPPNNSGSGTFEVTFRRGESLTIVASRKDWKTTTDKVNAKNYDYLKVDQERRDIPLKHDPVTYTNGDHPSGEHTDCYDLYAPGNFWFEWKVCSVCTMLIVKDSNGKVLRRFGTDDPSGGRTPGLAQVISPSSGRVMLTSSTQEICVTRVCVNGDTSWYSITTQ